MKFNIPSEVNEIIKKVSGKGYEIYIVGGAVRDMLLGKSVTDWDFTTSAKPEEILEIFKNQEAYHMGFGTVGIPAKDENLKPFEITTFRKEFGYKDKRRPDKVVWGDTLTEDLKRRDFTINALAIGKDKKIVDPFEGQKDLAAKVIRAVGEPEERFSEDALRMMRAVRIASELGFRIEKKTLEAIKTNATLIERISKERVRDELLKILASPHPYEGVVKLRGTTLLEKILPELEKAFGVDQKSPQRHHIYDVGTHLIYSLKACKNPDPIVRFACLIHDIGKPQTYEKLPNGVVTFYNHEIVGAKITKRIADRLRLSKKDKDKLWRLVRYHQFSVTEEQTDSAIRRFIRKVGLDLVPDMLDLRHADRVGSGSKETSWRTEEFKERLIEVQKEPFSIKDLKISGNDVMKTLKIKPGPKVGEILQKLFEEVEEKKIPNEREKLIQRVKAE